MTVSGTFSDPALGVGTETSPARRCGATARRRVSPSAPGHSRRHARSSTTIRRPGLRPTSSRRRHDQRRRPRERHGDLADRDGQQRRPVTRTARAQRGGDRRGRLGHAVRLVHRRRRSRHAPVSVDWGEGPRRRTVAPGRRLGTFTRPPVPRRRPAARRPTTTPITSPSTDDDTGSDSDVHHAHGQQRRPGDHRLVSSATFEDKAEEGETVTVSGSFTDVGTLDTHTVDDRLGRRQRRAGDVDQGVGGGTFTADHATSRAASTPSPSRSPTTTPARRATRRSPSSPASASTAACCRSSARPATTTSTSSGSRTRSTSSPASSPEHRRFDLAA